MSKKELILWSALLAVCLPVYAYCYADEITMFDDYTATITSTAERRVTLAELRSDRNRINAKIDRHLAVVNAARAERDVINAQINAIQSLGVIDVPTEEVFAE